MRLAALLSLALLGGCLDYDALSSGLRDLTGPGIVDLAGADLTGIDLGAPDLIGLDLTGVDLAGTDAAAFPIVRVDATATGVAVSQTNLAIHAPTTTLAGDLVLLQIWNDDPSKTIGAVTPSFTPLASLNMPGGQTARWYWRIAVAGEGATTYGVAFSGACNLSMMVLTYRGATTAAMTAPALHNEADPPVTVTTAQQNQAIVLMVGFFQLPTGTITWTAPAGFSRVLQDRTSVAFDQFVTGPTAVSVAMPQSSSNADPLLFEAVILSPP